MEPALSPMRGHNDFLTLIEVEKSGEVTVTKTQDLANLPEIIMTSQKSCNVIECAIKLLNKEKKSSHFDKKIIKTAKKIIDYYLELKTNSSDKSAKKSKTAKQEFKQSIAKELSLIANSYNEEIQSFKIRTQNFELENFFTSPKNNLDVDALIEILNVPDSEDSTGVHSSNGQDIMRHIAGGVVSFKNRVTGEEEIDYSNTSGFNENTISGIGKKEIFLSRFQIMLLQLAEHIAGPNSNLSNNIEAFINAIESDDTIDLDTLSGPLQSITNTWRHSNDVDEQKLAQLLLPLNQSFYVRPSAFIMHLINNKTSSTDFLEKAERWPDKILKLGETKFTVEKDRNINYEITEEGIAVKINCELAQTHSAEGKSIDRNSSESIKIYLTTKLLATAPDFDRWDLSIQSVVFSAQGDDELAEKINRLINLTNDKISSSLLLVNHPHHESKAGSQLNSEEQQAFLKSL